MTHITCYQHVLEMLILLATYVLIEFVIFLILDTKIRVKQAENRHERILRII